MEGSLQAVEAEYEYESRVFLVRNANGEEMKTPPSH
jgi:hypothetical protein